MMKSLYSGVAGLKVHNQRMDVIGNNISNVNTTAFKASTVTFKDIFYQNKSYASSGSITTGGTNANQVGYGASLNSISQVMTQGGLTYSDSVYDCAIQGEGFFQVMDSAGNIYYTRAGVFHVDNTGNLCDASGNIVLGVSGDPTGVAASSQRINLYVPSVDDQAASVTKTVNGYTFTVSASTYGEDGNISLTITDCGTDSPFATQSGTVITVAIDLSVDYASAEEFEDAVNAAIVAGGISLGDGVLPLNFEFEDIPSSSDILAQCATNTLTYTLTSTDDNDNEITEDINLTFTADVAGEYANAYEIDIVASENATEVKATWSDGTLKITIPTTGATVDEIQAAIDDAAGDTAKKAITVSGDDISATAAEIMAEDGTTLKIGLADGQDNFFKTMAETMGTIMLTGGRTAADQSVEDLESIFIDEDGVIYGVHSVHGTIALGRIDIVVFENPEGLDQVGTSYWKESLSSGTAQVKIAASSGAGSIVSGALEMSNTDLSQEISDMIITQRGFQANSRVITVSDTMLEELVNLKR